MFCCRVDRQETRGFSSAQSVSDSHVAWHEQDLFGFGLSILHLLSLSPAGDAPPAVSQTTGDDVEFLGWTYVELGAQVQHFQQRVRFECMSKRHETNAARG